MIKEYTLTAMRQVVYYVLQYFYFNSLLSTYYSELEQILYINYYTRPPACHMKWIAFFSQTDIYIVIFFSGPTSYTRGYMGQKFTFITSLSWHRMGSRLHPFWLYCSQQFYRMSNLQAIFVPSRPIHGWSIHFGK